MPRLPFVDTATAETRAIAGRVIEERGSMLDLYRLLLHSPPVASGWLDFLTAVRQRLALPADLRELVIIRIAILNHAPYEARQHTPIALESGVTHAQIEALGEWDRHPALFDDAAQAALAYTDILTRDARASDPVWAALHSRFCERECLELTVLIGAYNMVSRVLSALELD